MITKIIITVLWDKYYVKLNTKNTTNNNNGMHVVELQFHILNIAIYSRNLDFRIVKFMCSRNFQITR